MRLFIIGVKWPLETFIDRKVRMLSGNGVQVTVFTHSVKEGSFHVSVKQLFTVSGKSIWRPIFALLKKCVVWPTETIRMWLCLRSNLAPDTAIRSSSPSAR